MNKEKKIKQYQILAIIILFLTILIISCNYKSIQLLTDKNELSNQIKQQQILINNRTYIITALGIAENTTKLINQAELLKVTNNIPRFLLNSDYSISLDLQWRYNNLYKLLKIYSKSMTSSNNDYNKKLKNKMLYELNIVRSNFENIIQRNLETQHLNQQRLNGINSSIKYLLIVSVLIITLLLLSFYYFVHLVKGEKKIELKQFIDQNDFKNLFQKYLEDNVVIIEHSCQRIHYHNGLVTKQLNQQQDILKNMQENYKLLSITLNEVGEIYNNKSSTSKIPFKTYAKAIDLSGIIQKQISMLVQENYIIQEQLGKNKQYIKNIFQANQKMSFNIRQKVKSKDSELV